MMDFYRFMGYTIILNGAWTTAGLNQRFPHVFSEGPFNKNNNDIKVLLYFFNQIYVFLLYKIKMMSKINEHL